VRLTAELILNSPAFVNTLKERELDLRGNKISQIENLGATEDQYDVLDFSDNDITRLEGFPLLGRLSTVLLNNNRISTIDNGLGSKITNLENLILTNNRLENIGDLDPLVEFKKLQNLSLLRNPVTKQKHYRFYVIHKLPSLRILDFLKITSKERKEADKLFSGETGVKLVSTITQTKATPSQPDLSTSNLLTNDEKDKLKERIRTATSMEEVQRYERILQSSKIPKSLRTVLSTTPAGRNSDNGTEEMEDEETDQNDEKDPPCS